MASMVCCQKKMGKVAKIELVSPQNSTSISLPIGLLQGPSTHFLSRIGLLVGTDWLSGIPHASQLQAIPATPELPP